MDRRKIAKRPCGGNRVEEVSSGKAHVHSERHEQRTRTLRERHSRGLGGREETETIGQGSGEGSGRNHPRSKRRIRGQETGELEASESASKDAERKSTSEAAAAGGE